MDKYKIPVSDFLNQLKIRGATVDALNQLKTGEEDVPLQIAEMNLEKREKELLKYQLNRKVGNVNAFLLSKYSDGNFNEAVINGYDNSENRIKHSITFEYHVYYPKSTISGNEDEYKDYRPPQDYIVTKPFFSNFGDKYIYHIPIRRGLNSNGEPCYITDMNETLRLDGVSESKNGLVYALSTLSEKIKSNMNQIPKDVFQILRNHQFIDRNGKLDLAVPNKAVEKYMLNYMPTKKSEVIEYLNKEFAADDDVKKDVSKIEEIVEDKKVDEDERINKEAEAAIRFKKEAEEEEAEKKNKKEAKDAQKYNLSPQQIKDNYDTAVNNLNSAKERAEVFANTDYKKYLVLFGKNIDKGMKRYEDKIAEMYEQAHKKLDGKEVDKNEAIVEEFLDIMIVDLQQQIQEKMKKVETMHDDLYDKIEGEKPDRVKYNYTIKSVKGVIDEDKYKEYLEKEIKLEKERETLRKKEEDERIKKEAEDADKKKRLDEEIKKKEEEDALKNKILEDKLEKERLAKEQADKDKKAQADKDENAQKKLFNKAKEITLKEYKELLRLLVALGIRVTHQKNITSNIATLEDKVTNMNELTKFFGPTNVKNFENARNRLKDKSIVDKVIIGDEFPILKSGSTEFKVELDKLLRDNAE